MNRKSIIIFPLLLILFIFCLFSIDVLATETKSEDLAIREYVFLIDTSASMSKGKDVSDQGALYKKLQITIEEFVEGIQDDLSETGIEIRFSFYPFDEGIETQGNTTKSISSSDKNYKKEIINYIYSLKFLGHRTHICSSLEHVINKHEAIDRPVIIRLYTDGEENEKHPTTGEVLYPPWEEFWKKIKSLAEGIDWTENENLRIITLEIKWPPPPGPIPKVEIITEPDVPTIYHISVLSEKLDFGDLHDTGEEKRELTFSILSKEIDWNKFKENYPDLKINITHQEFRPEIEKFIRDFPPIRLSSLGDGKYNLTFKIDKDEMIKNENFGKFTGSLSLSINLKEVKEDIDVSIDNYIPISFNFYRPEVEVLPVSLNFGSLEKVDPVSQRISFNYNKKAIQDKSSFTISIELSEDDPSLLSIGKNILINNQTTKEVTVSAPTSYIDFQISLNQNKLLPGNYKGKLVFTSDELFIKGENLISDPEDSKIKYIPWIFTIPPSPVVTVNMLPTGEGKIPIDFGVIKEEKQYQQKIMLEFNQQAVDRKSNLGVSVDISPDNPSGLKTGENLFINEQGRKSIDIIAVTEEIELVLEVTPSELKYGKYYGRINFTSEELNIKDDNLKTDPTNPNQKYYEWTFKTPMPPWMKMLIGIIVLVVLLIIIYLILIIRRGGSISLPSLKSAKAVIPDETYLYIRNYDTGKREQINISGKKEVIIGKDGQYLNDIEERMTLRAIKEDGKNLVRLMVESGKVSLIKAGSMKEEIVIEQTIFNRDVIKFGNYQIRVSSFYLERDVN